MTVTELVAKLTEPVAAVVYLGLGALASQLWGRYLGRLAAFRWSALHNRLAVSGEHPHFGRVEVLWNDNAVKGLHFCSIEIENESSRDFSNVEIKIGYSDGTEILGEGQLSGSAQFLPWTSRYTAQLAAVTEVEVDKRDKMAVHDLLARREYVIPVFNRAAKFGITYMVSSTVELPYVHVTCDHIGVRLYERPQRQLTFGVVQAHASAVGLLAAIALTVITARLTHRVWAVAIVAFLSAAFGQLLGAAIVRAKRWMVRTIG